MKNLVERFWIAFGPLPRPTKFVHTPAIAMPVFNGEIILASRSPRRRELLTEAGYRFKVVPPLDPDECGTCSREGPAMLVARLAFEKAHDVGRQVGAGLVLGCDTVAEVDGQILGKPADEQHARRMLQLLRGKPHRVLSGVCLWQIPSGDPDLRIGVSTLQMDPISDQQIDQYLASGQWEGKAGAFGYQDRLGWIHLLEGEASNVVGLPLQLLADMLAAIGPGVVREPK